MITYKKPFLIFKNTGFTDTNALLVSFHIGKKQRYELHLHKCITVNNTIITQNQSLEKEDQIQIDTSHFENTDIPKENTPIDILYEDDFLLILNKPKGILVHDDGTQTITLQKRVANYIEETKQHATSLPLHRLDKETSGCILFSKLPFLQPLLDAMLEDKQIKREYLAICFGDVKKQEVSIGIGKDRHNAKKMIALKSGKHATTFLTPIYHENDKTLVSCVLTTGRTHQIRVHTSYVHHPILGDILYGGKKKDRMFLHSYRVVFTHPILQKEIIVIAPLPKAFKKEFEGNLPTSVTQAT